MYSSLGLGLALARFDAPAPRPPFAAENPDEPALLKELVLQVRKTIGPFAAPKKLVLVGDLPKTRSGKIVRRALRKIASGEGDQLGDLSTLAEPAIIDEIKEKFAKA
ncbi:acetyl-coenzyme A synthetase 2 [Rhodotorula kratochvilovae]